jgi:hypothetical protein
MTSPTKPLPAHAAILTLAEIKAAVDDFDRGESNAFDSIDAIVMSIEEYLAATKPGRAAA